jgi:Holliday junction DNA helicase RuvB
VQSIPISDFTLVGATTDLDALIQPLQDRFRIILHLDYSSEDELAEVVRQRWCALGWNHEPELLPEIAKRTRGKPRNALRLLQSAHRVLCLGSRWHHHHQPINPRCGVDCIG